MAASRMRHGVSKSGSPTPSEITSLCCATISKNSRMPDFGMSRMWSATRLLELMRKIQLRPSGSDRQPLRLLFAVNGHAILLVHFHPEMRGGGDDAFDRAELLRDERGNILQALPLDHHQQVVRTRHQIAALHLGEVRDPRGQPVKAAAPLGRDLDLD